MARECYVCGKKKTGGGAITRRGLAKKKGGIGRHVVKNVKRQFRPNLQKIRIREDGAVKRVLVCAKCIRNDRVLKA